MPESYKHSYTIGLHDTDAFQILYAANITRIFLTANEAMLESIGFGLAELFRRKEFGMPVAHIEADFRKPLTVGMHVDVYCRVTSLGTSSYRVAYDVVTPADGACWAEGATVQVCVDAHTREPIPIPKEFRKGLGKYLQPSD
jgi:1,4-dihydroxy-2-naphthoyl-CoA hydrolase